MKYLIPADGALTRSSLRFEPAIYSAGHEAAACLALLLDFFLSYAASGDDDHRNYTNVDQYWAAELKWATTVKKAEQIRNRLLSRILRNEAAFFDAGGYGKSFRSKWRPTLLLRDSPTCINYGDQGRQNSCRECPLFSLVPAEKQDRLLPCHHIQLNSQGETIAGLYARGSQESLDQLYRNWLKEKIIELMTS